MTPKKTNDPEGDDSLGMLDDTPSSDLTGIGLLGGTAQVSVVLPKDDDDDLADDEVTGGEIVSDLIIDTSAVADDVTVARISQDTPDIVIELPVEDLPHAAESETTAEADVVVEDDHVAEASDEPAGEIVIDAEPVTDAEEPVEREPESADAASADAVIAADTPDAAEGAASDAQPLAHIESAVAAAKAELREAMTPAPAKKPAERKPARKPRAKAAASAGASATKPSAAGGDATAGTEELASSPRAAEEAAPAPEPAEAGEPVKNVEPVKNAEPVKRAATEQAETASEIDAVHSAGIAETARPAPAEQAAPASASAEEEPPVHDDEKAVARAASAPSRSTPEVALTAKRLDDLGDASRESADLLTADRLLDPSRVSKPEPEGTWSHLLYAMSGGRINIGDSRKARERKQLTARIAAPLAGTARFVPVLSRKGGVGKTTVTALLGMALADARDDRVIAVDANPDRGTLAERVVGASAKSVRDLVRAQQDIRGFHDISALVARDETRLDVLASDSDPRVAEAFGDAGYRDVATVAAQYYSLVLTDSGTGIVHSVMGATLDLADQLVVVSGLSVDEARLASETLTWLETNGHAELARDAIVVLNQSTPGTPMVRLSELEAHFSTRARHVLRIPYDPQIAGGGPIDFASLQPQTRQAARELAASLIEGLRAKAAA